MKACLVFLFSILAIATKAQSKELLSTEALQVLSQLYSYKPIRTSHLSIQEKKYLEAYGHFLAFIADEESDHVEAFELCRKQFTEVYNTDCPQRPLLAINLAMQNGLLHLMSGKEYSGVYIIYKAYKSFLRLDSLRVNRKEYQKLQGLFLIFAHQVESRSSFASRLLGVDGDAEKGFQLLRSYAKSCQKSTGLEVEAQVLLAYCLLKFGEASDGDFEILLSQCERHESPLLSFVSIMLFIKERNTPDAMKLLSLCEDSICNKFPLLLYAKGRLFTNLLSEDGERYLKQFLVKFRGESFKKDALLRLARMQHINQDEYSRDSLLLRMEESTINATAMDKQAMDERLVLAQTPIALLKARLLFDGGQYGVAKSVLLSQNINEFGVSDQLEYSYRMGRIEHVLQNLSMALLWYRKVVDNAYNDKRYYGPYAAIWGAHIAMEKKDYSLAAHFVKRGFDLNNGQYQRIIDARLNALESRL